MSRTSVASTKHIASDLLTLRRPLHTDNNKVLADKYAQGTGAAVYLPDYFDGEDLVKQGMLEGKKVDVPALIGKYHPREAAWKNVEQTVAEIKKLQPGAKIGAVGFCWGATSCIHLGSKDAGANQVDAVAFCHPSLIEPTDFHKLDKPGVVSARDAKGEMLLLH